VFEFSVSGVETFWWFPPLVAFLISCITVTGGLSGAFLLLPFQMSILGYTTPGVSPTNLIFSIIAIPSGVYRYYLERRMVWPLACAIILGTLPGMFIGAMLRVNFLHDPFYFKPFVGLVLADVGILLLLNVIRNRKDSKADFSRQGLQEVTEAHFSFITVSYRFGEKLYTISTPKISILSFIVGIVGGTYGIGGGAVIAPILISVIGLPVYTVAGAALFSTLVGSIGGVVSYWVIGLMSASVSGSTSPDWVLGGLLGLGGAAGMYVGARLQRFLPAQFIKTVLMVCLLAIAVRYLSVLF